MPQTRKALLLALVFAAGSPAAMAAKPDKFAATFQQMEAASQRYREAQVRLQNGDDAAMGLMSKAIEDIEDLAVACLKQKGCEASRVITVYETLLKEQGLAPELAEAGENTAEPDHSLSPVLANSPEAARSLKLLNDGHAFDKMVELNEPVQAGIREWLTSQRAFLIDSWENYQYMRYLMYPEYEKAGLPEALLFGIMAKESGGKVHAVSRAGASGPLQFMYGTGSRFGLGKDATGFDTRFDPQFAARANAAYVNERFRELNRSLEYTVAAYNGGEGRAARLYSATGGQSFWSPQAYGSLPPETRDYVPMVIAAAWLFLHPKQYGLEFPKIDTTPGDFTLSRATSINELTICLGNGGRGGNRDGWFRVLRNLNPRYDNAETIPAGTTLRAPKRLVSQYQLFCQQGPRAELASQLMRASKYIVPAYAASALNPVDANAPMASAQDAVATREKKKEKSRVHEVRVRKGDTLASIARAYRCDLGDMAKLNRLKAPGYAVRPGQRLKLKGCGD
jgi:membrane-bound lytic murein transglycosylase D